VILVINTECNRSCSYCFEGQIREEKKENMSLDTIFQVLEFSNNPVYTIMGGEPTLHPELLQILDLVNTVNTGFNPSLITLLTNGLGNIELSKEIAKKIKCTGLNLNHLDFYTNEEYEKLIKNIEIFSNKTFLTLTVTITDPKDDFTLLYDILKSNLGRNILYLRIAISSPGYKFSNLFPKEFSQEYGEAYLKIIETCHKINPIIRYLNECSINLCLMEKNIYDKLKNKVLNFKLECYGNFDFFPDHSSHWCFACEGIPELTIENIFKYQNETILEAEFFKRQTKFNNKLGVQCNYNECKEIECLGPCVAYNYYRKKNDTI